MYELFLSKARYYKVKNPPKAEELKQYYYEISKFYSKIMQQISNNDNLIFSL